MGTRRKIGFAALKGFASETTVFFFSIIHEKDVIRWNRDSEGGILKACRAAASCNAAET